MGLFSRARFLAFAAALGTLAAGCSGGGTTPTPQIAPNASASRLPQTSWDGRELFVYDITKAEIAVFSPDAQGNATPVRVINSPILGSLEVNAMATDGKGYLYVLLADPFGLPPWQILVFAPFASGPALPVRTILATQTTYPEFTFGMDVDAQGTVYLSRRFEPDPTAPTQIYVYAPGANGAVPPNAILTSEPTPTLFNGLAVSEKYIYAEVENSLTDPLQIEVFPKTAQGLQTPLCTITNTTVTSGEPGLETIARNGDHVWVSVFDRVTAKPALYGFKPCSSVPENIIAGPNTGLTYPAGLVFDEKGVLYVAVSGAVLVFGPNNQHGNVSPNAIITTLVTPTQDTIGP